MKKKTVIVLVIGCAFAFSLACSLLGPQRGPLNFHPDSLPAAQAGVPYDVRITITGNVTPAGQFSVPDGALPAGLAFETLEGENAARIFGTPKEAGSFKLKVFVWCYGTNVSGQTAEKEYLLTIK